MRTPCGSVIQRQYHAITRRDYYRLAGAAQDTAGRPSCKMAGGRTVYGGGGIYPDVVLPDRAGLPLWLAQVQERDLLLKWTGGYVTANSAAFPSIEALAGKPLVADTALAEFRAFAAQQGVSISAGTTADSLLQRVLVRAVARVKFGEAGYYRLAAVLDPTVRQAAEQFERASAILATTP